MRTTETCYNIAKVIILNPEPKFKAEEKKESENKYRCTYSDGEISMGHLGKNPDIESIDNIESIDTKLIINQHKSTEPVIKSKIVTKKKCDQGTCYICIYIRTNTIFSKLPHKCKRR